MCPQKKSKQRNKIMQSTRSMRRHYNMRDTLARCRFHQKEYTHHRHHPLVQSGANPPPVLAANATPTLFSSQWQGGTQPGVHVILWPH
jgi:hypothetical protein